LKIIKVSKRRRVTQAYQANQAMVVTQKMILVIP